MDMFWSSQNWTNLGVISMHLASFLKVYVQNGNISLGLLKFQIILENA